MGSVEQKSSEISKSKTEYVKCIFSNMGFKCSETINREQRSTQKIDSFVV